MSISLSVLFSHHWSVDNSFRIGRESSIGANLHIYHISVSVIYLSNLLYVPIAGKCKSSKVYTLFFHAVSYAIGKSCDQVGRVKGQQDMVTGNRTSFLSFFLHRDFSPHKFFSTQI